MNFSGELSTQYERGIRRTLPSYDVMLRLTQTFLQANVKKNAHLYAIGVGSGNELLHLLQNEDSWQFTAIDIAQAMLDITSQKINEQGYANRVKLINGTVFTVPEAQYNGATCLLVLHFIKERQLQRQTIMRIAEQLVPGAPFVISCKYVDTETIEGKEQLKLWRNYWLQNTPLTTEAINKMEASLHKAATITEEDIVMWLTEAGFVNISRFFATTIFAGWTCYKV